MLGRGRAPADPRAWWALLPLSLHAGWLALAAFLNLAQVIVAYRLLSTTNMLPWSLVLLAGAVLLLLFWNRRMQGNPAFALAGAWGLVGVYVKQSASELAGAPVAAMAAAAAAGLLVLQTLWLRVRRA